MIQGKIHFTLRMILIALTTILSLHSLIRRTLKMMSTTQLLILLIQEATQMTLGMILDMTLSTKEMILSHLSLNPISQSTRKTILDMTHKTSVRFPQIPGLILMIQGMIPTTILLILETIPMTKTMIQSLQGTKRMTKDMMFRLFRKHKG